MCAPRWSPCRRSLPTANSDLPTSGSPSCCRAPRYSESFQFAAPVSWTCSYVDRDRGSGIPCECARRDAAAWSDDRPGPGRRSLEHGRPGPVRGRVNCPAQPSGPRSNHDQVVRDALQRLTDACFLRQLTVRRVPQEKHAACLLEAARYLRLHRKSYTVSNKWLSCCRRGRSVARCPAECLQKG